MPITYLCVFGDKEDLWSTQIREIAVVKFKVKSQQVPQDDGIRFLYL